MVLFFHFPTPAHPMTATAYYPLLALALLAAPALAQTAPVSPAQQRAANRQALRDAHHTEADYKDSHLDVSGRNLRRGASETAAPVPHEPRFGRNGQPRVAQPLFSSSRHRKVAQAEPAP